MNSRSELYANTPGPWKVDYEIFEQWRINSEGGMLIARTEGWREPEQELANAVLIAAAPELLKACEDMVIYLDSLYAVGYPCGKEEQRLHSWMKAAIVKAKYTEHTP